MKKATMQKQSNNNISVTFTATVHLGGKTATGIEVPGTVVQQLSSQKRIPVSVTINTHTYRTTLAPYRGAYMIPLSAENREPAGVAAGDIIEVTLAPDEAPRTVDIPEELQAALDAQKGAAAAFDALSVSARKEHVRQVTTAKAPETRSRRIEKIVASL